MVYLVPLLMTLVLTLMKWPDGDVDCDIAGSGSSVTLSRGCQDIRLNLQEGLMAVTCRTNVEEGCRH